MPSVMTYQLNLYQHKQIMSNTHQSNSCCGPGPGVGSTGGLSESTFFAVVQRLDIPENVKTFVGIRHFVCQLVRTLVNKAEALHDVWQR